MIIKKSFELIYKKDVDVYNIVPISRTTLKSFSVDKNDFNYFKTIVDNLLKKKYSSFLFLKQVLDDCFLVDMPQYPLPGFVTNKFIPVVNLAYFPITSISDYNHSDLLAMYVYSMSLKYFLLNSKYITDFDEYMMNMFFSVMMRWFGKKSGLLGSFSYLIPKLRFFIAMYINCSILGKKSDDGLKRKIASGLFLNLKDLKLDYDFSSIIQLFRAIDENSIISISENTFSSTTITRLGVSALPAFEDLGRFCSTILASSVFGNQVFNSGWGFINKTLYPKIIQTSLASLKRMNI